VEYFWALWPNPNSFSFTNSYPVNTYSDADGDTGIPDTDSDGDPVNAYSDADGDTGNPDTDSDGNSDNTNTESDHVTYRTAHSNAVGYTADNAGDQPLDPDAGSDRR
jgi:hypothetical protein